MVVDQVWCTDSTTMGRRHFPLTIFRFIRRLAYQRCTCLLVATVTVIAHVCLLRLITFTFSDSSSLASSSLSANHQIQADQQQQQQQNLVMWHLIPNTFRFQWHGAVTQPDAFQSEKDKSDSIDASDQQQQQTFGVVQSGDEVGVFASASRNGPATPETTTATDGVQQKPVVSGKTGDNLIPQTRGDDAHTTLITGSNNALFSLELSVNTNSNQRVSLDTASRSTQQSVKADIADIETISESNKAVLVSEKIRIVRRGSWQCQKLITKQSSDELCVYSAVLDDRPLAANQPTVRIAAVSTMKQEDLPAFIACRFVMVDALKNVRLTQVGGLIDVVVTRVGRGHKVQTNINDNKQIVLYAQVMLSCALPTVDEAVRTSSLRPDDITHVSIVPLGTSKEPLNKKSTTNLLQIYRPVLKVDHLGENGGATYSSPFVLVEFPQKGFPDRTQPKFEHEFGICVPIAFGSLDPVLLVNWVEMNKLMGVTEISIYNASLSADSDVVLTYYKELIVVHQIIPPVPDRTYGGVKLGSPAGLNDCMYRNMYRYHYVIIVDFDELIMPRPDVDYAMLMSQIVRSRQAVNKLIHSYSVKNAFFYLSYPHDENFPFSQLYLRHRTRFDSKAVNVLDKSFINPRLCLSAFNHYCYKPLTNTTRFHIHTSLALVHHYTSCKKRCELMDGSAMRDDRMMKFKMHIKDNVLPVLELLKLNSGKL